MYIENAQVINLLSNPNSTNVPKTICTNGKLTTIVYETENKNVWDDFISNSKNGNFLFYRDYMDYHSDRFKDHSLMFFKGKNLVAVMPANIQHETLFSHDGLTFGGIISNKEMKTPLMIEIFESLKKYLCEIGVKKIFYKPAPHIYHKIPAEEDLYALFLSNAKLVGRDNSSTILMENKVNFDRNRKRCIKSAMKNEIEIKRSYDFKAFMALEEVFLNKRYGVKPTHTPEEMDFLSLKFPKNIKLFSADLDGQMIAGTIFYESETVAHCQYAAFTEKGKELHGEDLIMNYLFNDYYLGKKYVEFGKSTERFGRYLNENLIHYKEGFGARAIIYDHYIVEV